MTDYEMRGYLAFFAVLGWLTAEISYAGAEAFALSLGWGLVSCGAALAAVYIAAYFKK